MGGENHQNFWSAFAGNDELIERELKYVLKRFETVDPGFRLVAAKLGLILKKVFYNCDQFESYYENSEIFLDELAAAKSLSEVNDMIDRVALAKKYHADPFFSKKDNSPQTREVLSGQDGYKIVQLLTEDALRRESHYMRLKNNPSCQLFYPEFQKAARPSVQGSQTRPIPQDVYQYCSLRNRNDEPEIILVVDDDDPQGRLIYVYNLWGNIIRNSRNPKMLKHRDLLRQFVEAVDGRLMHFKIEEEVEKINLLSGYTMTAIADAKELKQKNKYLQQEDETPDSNFEYFKLYKNNQQLPLTLAVCPDDDDCQEKKLFVFGSRSANALGLDDPEVKPHVVAIREAAVFFKVKIKGYEHETMPKQTTPEIDCE